MRIDDEVLDVLKHMEIEGNIARMPKLDRALYLKVNKVLDSLGGKWNRKLNGHLFDGDPGDRLNDAVTTGETIDAKKEFQFFETPDRVADMMVKQAGIEFGHRVLEPSAGRGRIISAIERVVGIGRIAAVEINPEMVTHLRARFPLMANSVYQADFLTETNELGFDRVVMNPPFRNGQDIAHVRHAWSMLRPGGRLVAITAPGWTFRTDRKHTEFRDWLRGDSGVTEEELPEGTFKESGTMIRTMLIIKDKS